MISLPLVLGIPVMGQESGLDDDVSINISASASVASLPDAEVVEVEDITLTEINISVKPVNFELDESFRLLNLQPELVFLEPYDELAFSRRDFLSSNRFEEVGEGFVGSAVLRQPFARNEDGSWSVLTDTKGWMVFLDHPLYVFAQNGNVVASNRIGSSLADENATVSDRIAADLLQLVSFSAISRDGAMMKPNERDHFRRNFKDYLDHSLNVSLSVGNKEAFYFYESVKVLAESGGDGQLLNSGKPDLQTIFQIQDAIRSKADLSESQQEFLKKVSQETVEHVDQVSSQSVEVQVYQLNGEPADGAVVELFVGRSHLMGEEDSFFGAHNGKWDTRVVNAEGVATIPFCPLEGIARVRVIATNPNGNHSAPFQLSEYSKPIRVQIQRPFTRLQGFVTNYFHPTKHAVIEIKDQKGLIAQTTSNGDGYFQVSSPSQNRIPTEVHISIFENNNYYTYRAPLPDDLYRNSSVEGRDLFFDIFTMELVGIE